MKESMPSRVQPDQAAQKPVICARDSLVCGCAAAGAALDMLDLLLMKLFPLASLYWLFLKRRNKSVTVFLPNAYGHSAALKTNSGLVTDVVTVPAPRRAARSPAPVPRVRLTLDGR